jgi:cytoskeletal protein CcmA (bactofilin family)
MFRRKQSNAKQIKNLIGVNTRINGDIEFCGGLHLDGTITGNVSSSSKEGANLSVSEQGGIEGSVFVADIVLNGVVKGDIDATGRVELGEKARVSGNVRYSVIETAVGAQINGKLVHRQSADLAGAVQAASLQAVAVQAGDAPTTGDVAL